MKKLFLALVTVVVVLLAVMAINAARLPAGPSPAPRDGERVEIDETIAAQRLAGAVRFRTVSYASGAPIDTAAFLGFHEYVRRAFPRVHSALGREPVNGLSLLYTWRGSDTTAAPLVLMGHMDVVPVPDENLKDWQHGPFSGDIADGFVWGRGTLDDKTTVLAVLEAVEHLVANGYRPKRTVYLCFGHDEEVAGRYGARAIVDTLVRRGVKPALVIDEGGVLADGNLIGLPGRAAMVGVAEKGYVSLRLTARAAGGHSSMPPRRTAVGTLARAITVLEERPFPYRLTPPVRAMLEAMAPSMPFGQRMVIGNLWLTAPLVTRGMAASPTAAAMLHTTTAPTILDAGVKDNVLPPEASAVVNFRILSGETQESVIARVREVIADSAVTVEPTDSARMDPTRVSDPDSPGFQLIAEAIRGMVPGDAVPVLPFLLAGGTDAKYWAPHSTNVYRFLPIPLGEEDISRLHGVNERVRAADYATAVGFFVRIIRSTERLQ